MQDLLYCPLCDEKFNNSYYPDINLRLVDKWASFVRRTCNGLNHSLQLWADKETKMVDHLKMSLTPQYSQFILIDFHNNKCQISFFKNGLTEYIDVPRIIEPDFPTLTKLKEKVATYICLA